jgi:hypothetical protein
MIGKGRAVRRAHWIMDNQSTSAGAAQRYGERIRQPVAGRDSQMLPSQVSLQAKLDRLYPIPLAAHGWRPPLFSQAALPCFPVLCGEQPLSQYRSLPLRPRRIGQQTCRAVTLPVTFGGDDPEACFS